MSEVGLYLVIRGVLLPAVICGAIYLIARFTPESFRTALRSAGVAAGVGVAYVLLIGWPELPWMGSPRGIFAAVMAASVWPLVEAQTRRRIWLARYLIFSSIAVLILWPFLLSTWNVIQSAQMIIAAATLGVFAWAVIERGSARMHAAGTLAVFAVMAGGSAAIMAMDGSASIGHVAGALAAALGAAMALSLIGFVRPGRTELNATFLLLLGALWIGHGFFVETDWLWNLWILSPVALFMARAMTNKLPDKPVKDAAFCGIVALIPVGFALVKSFQRLV